MHAEISTTKSFEANLKLLAEQVKGPVFTPGEDGYGDETAAWNLAVGHRPLVAVGATSVADVQAAVRFAASLQLPIAVLATGHGSTISADGAVLINLRRMNDIRIDAPAQRATVGAAVEMQSLVDAAAAAGLAPLAGSSPNVGVVGYTLGGGLSPALGRAYGFAADHVTAAQIVTADGEVRQIDADTEPDLFWAICGGKGNFGVITALTFGLVRVARLYCGGLYFAGEHAAAVADAYRRVVAKATDDLSVSIVFLRMPDVEFVPEPLRNRFVVHVRVAYLGSAPDGEQLIKDLRQTAPAMIDTVAEMPFNAVTAIHADPLEPLPVYEASALLRDFPEAAAAALLAVAGPGIDTPVLAIEIRHLGGALGRPGPVPSAVGHRDARFQLFVGAVGAPDMLETFRAPLEEVQRALAPWSTGGHAVNFLGNFDIGPGDAESAYEPETYARLRDVKSSFDPDNLFRINHNIPPRRALRGFHTRSGC